MLKKTVLAILLIPFSALLFSFTIQPPTQKGFVLKTIIVDAGHGIMANGGYNGAAGNYSHEDDIALAVSKKLVADLTQEFPGVKIVETRPTKYITSLHERANIANENHGDLFISIHVNAMPPIKHKELVGHKTEVYYTGKGKKRRKHTKKVPVYHYWETPDVSAKGTQTYIWGTERGHSEQKELAIRENAPMFQEENYQQTYGGIDPNSPDFIAMSYVTTKKYTTRSALLAQMVEDEFAKTGRTSGGPHQRQVGIWVLQATAMPSILVETGFITNPQEEDYLNSQDGQSQIAASITNAVKNYETWLEKRQLSNNGNAINTPAPTKNNNNKSSSTYSALQATEQNKLKKAGK